MDTSTESQTYDLVVSGNYLEGVRICKEVLKKDPTKFGVRINLGWAYERLNEKYLSLACSIANVKYLSYERRAWVVNLFWNNLGVFWYNVEELDKGFECWEKAISLEQTNPLPYFNRVEAFLLQGKESEAENLFEYIQTSGVVDLTAPRSLPVKLKICGFIAHYKNINKLTRMLGISQPIVWNPSEHSSAEESKIFHSEDLIYSPTSEFATVDLNDASISKTKITGENSAEEVTTIYYLPREILLSIFVMLEVRSLCRCAQVCKLWCHYASDNKLWAELCKIWVEDFHSINQIKGITINWKNVFEKYCEDLKVQADSIFQEAISKCPDFELKDQINETVKLWKSKLDKKLQERVLKELFQRISIVQDGNRRKELIWDFWKHSRRLNKGEVSIHSTIEFSQIQLGPKLGEGTVGVVHEATWKSQKVAVKFLDSKDSLSDQIFTTEIVLMSLLKHRNLLTVYGSGVKDKLQSFYVMPLIKGNLRSLISNGPLDSYRAAKISIDITLAMKYLHSMSIFHKNLKPENCLVNNFNSVVIADLGISGLDNETLKSYIKTVKNKNYMAPELVDFVYDSRESSKIDVYSFGVILWELLTGKHPNPQEAGFLLFKKQKLSVKLAPEIFHPVLKKCLNVNPTQRPKFVELLEEMLLLFYKTSTETN